MICYPQIQFLRKISYKSLSVLSNDRKKLHDSKTGWIFWEITILPSPDVITPIHAINDHYIFKSCPSFSRWDFMPILNQDLSMLLSSAPSPWDTARTSVAFLRCSCLQGPKRHLRSFPSVWRHPGNPQFPKQWPWWPM